MERAETAPSGAVSFVASFASSIRRLRSFGNIDRPRAAVSMVVKRAIITTNEKLTANKLVYFNKISVGWPDQQVDTGLLAHLLRTAKSGRRNAGLPAALIRAESPQPIWGVFERTTRTAERKKHSRVSGRRRNDCLIVWRRGWDGRRATGYASTPLHPSDRFLIRNHTK